MGINLLIIAVILALFTVGMSLFIKKTLSFEDNSKGTENFTSLESIENYVYETISSTIRQQLKDLDLTEQQAPGSGYCWYMALPRHHKHAYLHP